MALFDEVAALTPEQLAALPVDDYARLKAIIELEHDIYRKTLLYRAYPDTGPLRRELYPKHLAHFAAGATYQERALVGGNRSGKTFGCSYECALHLTGWYPHWWVGRKFDRPVTMWAAGEDTKAVRESLQVTYLGPTGDHGTGLIPADNIIKATPRPGVPDAVDSVTVKHLSGGVSRMLFKSYDQGRESFQAAKIDIMQFDEEPPLDIYSEGLTRTLSTVPGQPSGLVICGFTPLRGLSAVVLSFMPGGARLEGEVKS